MGISFGDGRWYDEEHQFTADSHQQQREPLRLTITPHMNAGEGEFDTPLTSEEQQSYSQKYSPQDNYDYDMQGFHKYNPDFQPGPGQHYPDTYKKPNHPTFSNESIYSGGEHEGGQWQQNPDKSYQFTPGRTNLENHSSQELQEYFNKVEPGNKLNLPESKLEEPKDIHIIRHGTTKDNEEDKIRGTQDDVKLSDEGRKHALEAAEELRGKGIESLVTSPLARAKETSQIIGKELGIPITVSDKLKTWNVGNFEGKPCEGNNDTLQDYAENKPDEKVPGGESYNEFKDRAFEGIREAILANKDKKLGIVTHHMVESSLEGWEKTGQDNPSLDLSKLFNDTDKPGSVRKMTMQPDSSIMKEYKPTFRDVLRGWLRGTNPSPQRAQIVDQLLGHTEAGEQSDLHNLNIGSLVNMQPEDIVGTNEGMFVAPSLGKKLFAQGLLKQGLSPDKVKSMTGVERGAEGKLRQEISDLPSRMTFEHPGSFGPYDKYKLSQLLHHPELYKVYPELKDVDVAYNHNMGQYTDARMNVDANTIELGSNLRDPFDIHDALLHEIQHWIQHKEGFAFNVPADAPASFVKAYKANMRKVNDPLTVKQRIYMELASEVEARNVQRRAGMTDEQRRASLATFTEDQPRLRQLIFDEQGNRITASPSSEVIPFRRAANDNEPGVFDSAGNLESGFDIDKAWKQFGESQKETVKKDKFKVIEGGKDKEPSKNPEMSRHIMSEEEAKYLVEKGGSLRGYNLRHTNPDRPKGGSKKGGPGRPRGPEWFKEEMEQTLEKELLQGK